MTKSTLSDLVLYSVVTNIQHTLRLRSQFSLLSYLNKKNKFPFSCLKFFFLGCKAYFSIHLGHIIYKNLIYLSHVTFRSTVTCHILRKLSIFGLTRGVKNFKMRHFFGQFEKNAACCPQKLHL